MTRWQRFKKAFRWLWYGEPLTDTSLLQEASKYLEQYDNLYGERTKISNPQFRDQAAAIVAAEGHKRAPSIESEVRVLAITLERLTKHLRLEAERGQT